MQNTFFSEFGFFLASSVQCVSHFQVCIVKEIGLPVVLLATLNLIFSLKYWP